MRCLVTGASGAVGPVLVDRLIAEGHQVTVFSRHPDRIKWPASVNRCAGNLLDSIQLAAAMTGIEVVFHLAALLHVANPASALRSDYQRVNVDGTRAVVETAKRAGVRRVLFFSTIAVYGATDGQVVNETTTPMPDTMYARTKLEAEAIVLSAVGTDGRRLGTVLRCAAVYGARVKGNYLHLVRALDGRRFVPIGNGRNRRTVIFDEDLADAAVTATGDAAAGHILNVSDGRFHTLSEIIAAIAQGLDRRPPHFHIPAAPVRLFASAADVLLRAAQVHRALRPALDTYLSDVAVDATRIQHDLGWHPRFDLQTGWQRAISTMKDIGSL